MAESGSEELLKLLTHWVTPYGQRLEIALKLKGVPYEAVEVQLWPEKPQFLLDANPVHKKIPVLIHKGRPLAESMIILEYIEETWPLPSLFPASDSYDRGIARFWGDFISKLLEGTGRNLLLGAGQQQEEAKEEILAKLAILNKAFIDTSGGRPFFMGDHLAFVDLVFAPLFFLFPVLENIAGLKIPDSTEWPLFHQWIHTVGEHPCVKPLRPDPQKQLDYFTEVTERLARQGTIYK